MAIRNGNFRGGSIKSLSFTMYLDFSPTRRMDLKEADAGID